MRDLTNPNSHVGPRRTLGKTLFFEPKLDVASWIGVSVTMCLRGGGPFEVSGPASTLREHLLMNLRLPRASCLGTCSRAARTPACLGRGLCGLTLLCYQTAENMRVDHMRKNNST